MDFFTPALLIGFGTLVVLEVVLGIDNLVFIAILSDKLPPEQRAKARMLGLTFALIMRLGLLQVISWIIGLTTPLFFVLEHGVSGRDLILLAGGLFLLFKATTELHERLEGNSHATGQSRNYASFWMVVTQIVVLDAVFSLDSIITAVGIMNHLPIMMAAVVIAMILMLVAAKPLTHFVNAHPTVVVLCLSFLLLIGLSLIAESMGAHLPKGYLYAAIGFSILIEAFNQLALHNQRKNERKRPLRLRTAEAVMRLLGGVPMQAPTGQHDVVESPNATGEASVFASEEVNMVSRVLTLSERTVRSIMTHRADAAFLNLNDTPEAQKALLLAGTPSILPVCKGSLDTVQGVAHAAALLGDLMQYGAIRPETLEEPTFAPASSRVITLLESLRSNPVHLVFVADEFGSIEGLVTFMDIFEAIAGELHDEDEPATVQPLPEGGWRIMGTADVHVLESLMRIANLVSESNDYTSLAGFALSKLGRLPEAGDSFEHEGYRFTVEAVAERRIVSILVNWAETDS